MYLSEKSQIVLAIFIMVLLVIIIAEKKRNKFLSKKVGDLEYENDQLRLNRELEKLARLVDDMSRMQPAKKEPVNTRRKKV